MPFFIDFITGKYNISCPFAVIIVELTTKEEQAMKNLLIHWEDAESQERMEIAFANRNKMYGGYVIRKRYNASLIIALLITTSLFLAASLIPMFGKKPAISLTPISTRDSLVIDITEVFTNHTDPINRPIEQPIDRPLPGGSTTKNTEYTVVNTLPPNSELPPINDVMKGSESGTKTQTGVGTGTPPDVPIYYKPAPDTTIHTIPTITAAPEYPGGMKKLYQDLQRNLHYPQNGIDNRIAGKVYVSFVIETDGSISNIKVVRDLPGGFGTEAVKAIKKLRNWEPGINENKPVRVSYMLPVNFQLKD